MAAGAYSSRILKGGALLEDMRALVRAWPPPESSAEAVARHVHQVLAKETTNRSADVLKNAFGPRFIKGSPPDAWRLIRPLEDAGLPIAQLRPLYYWITARSDRLVYEYVTEYLASGTSQQARIDAIHSDRWVVSKTRQAGLEWSEQVTIRIAQGILAALRDFGILEGSVKKRLAPFYLPVPTFAYVAFILNTLGAHGTSLVEHPDWGLFLLATRQQRERMFLEAGQFGLLTYHAAGSLVRIEFPAATLEEYVRVVVERSPRTA